MDTVVPFRDAFLGKVPKISIYHDFSHLFPLSLSLNGYFCHTFQPFPSSILHISLWDTHNGPKMKKKSIFNIFLFFQKKFDSSSVLKHQKNYLKWDFVNHSLKSFWFVGNDLDFFVLWSCFDRRSGRRAIVFFLHFKNFINVLLNIRKNSIDNAIYTFFTAII